jgi:pimeloyl-ACP methyl ester carboxylesterase
MGKLSLLGHSHGGRIAIAVAARGHLSIEHLYLCAASGIRHRFSPKRSIGRFSAAIGKAIFRLPIVKRFEPFAKKIFYMILGEHDYERASPIMKRTLANVISVDVCPLLQKIAIPTDLFWGEEDTMTPLSDGRTMQENITGSTLHTFLGVCHRVHRDRATEIATIIRSHLRSTP